MAALDPFRKPPEDLSRKFKIYQKLSADSLKDDPHIVDFPRDSSTKVAEAFTSSRSCTSSVLDCSLPHSDAQDQHATYFSSKELPGLVVAPLLFSNHAQTWLLDRLLHRDLINNSHLTNLHKHYEVQYDACKPSIQECDHCEQLSCPEHYSSFFNLPPSSTNVFRPLDATVHKPLAISQALNRKLRWLTLGGQYDWSDKRYPDSPAPAFPKDIKALVQDYFPGMTPEAAIVNIYSPGDTLSLHRDVSEDSDQGLVSISIGCDALFLVGLEGGSNASSKHHILRLRSGDAVYMSGNARYAWHGVPRILPSTCPPGLQSWPANGEKDSAQKNDPPDQFEAWRNWMAGKRINLNVRQMFSEDAVRTKPRA